MSRYFFHVGDTDEGLDPVGLEFTDVNLARIEAVRALGEVLRDKAGEFWTAGAMKMTVTDADGLVLFILDLSAIESPAIGRWGRP